MSDEAPKSWRPPFCIRDDDGGTCPVCKEPESVRIRDEETYMDGSEYEAYCAECHAELVVWASIDISFTEAEIP